MPTAFIQPRTGVIVVMILAASPSVNTRKRSLLSLACRETDVVFNVPLQNSAECVCDRRRLTSVDLLFSQYPSTLVRFPLATVGWKGVGVGEGAG